MFLAGHFQTFELLADHFAREANVTVYLPDLYVLHFNRTPKLPDKA